MFGSEILEVAVGVVFTFLVASLIASGVREIIESVLKTRAVQLERGVRLLLDDPDGTNATRHLFDHPLIYGLFEGDYRPDRLTDFLLGGRRRTRWNAMTKRMPLRSNLPTYIPSRNFALAMMDLVGGSGTGAGPLSMESLRANILTLPDGRVKTAMLSALGEAKNDIDRFRTSVEAWFDSNMDRVSAWYKRETQWILLGLGLLLAVGLNIDAVHVARTLAQSNTVRGTPITSAEKIRADSKGAAAEIPSEPDRLKELHDLSNVIGWRALLADADAAPPDRSHAVALTLAMLAALPGWLMTAVAVSLGAPFWFDVLNKIMVIRSTVKPFEKSPAEGSQDRSPGTPAAERLEPAPAAAAANPVPAPPAPAPVTVRLAIDLDGADGRSLQLIVDGGAAVPVPADGLLELPLEPGTPHTLAVAPAGDGQPALWSQSFVVTPDEEGLALHAHLIPA